MAQYEDLIVDQGSDASLELYLTDKNGSKKELAGHTITGMIRKNYTTVDSDATSFVTVIDTPTIDGKVIISLDNLTTGGMKAGRYLYDIELSYVDSDANTIIERILEGKLEVTPQITR